MNLSIRKGQFKKIAWTVLDQGLFSGTNFLLNVYLARVLGVDEYGGFAVGYSVFLFAANINKAYLVESFLVLGSGKYKEKIHKFLGIVFYQHILISLALLILFVPIYYLFLQQSSPLIRLSIIGAMFSISTISLLWVLRRSAYILSKPQLPAFGGMLYLVVVFLLLFLYRSFFEMSVLGAFLILSVSSITVIVLFILIMKPILSLNALRPSLRYIMNDQWSFGRWSILSAFLNWVPNNLFIYVLLYFYSLREPGEYKAILNIVLPIQHLISGLSLILLPSLSKLVFERDKAKFIKQIQSVLLVIVLGSCFYTIVLIVFGKEITQFLYGNNYQFESIFYYIITGFLVFSIGLSFLYASIFRSLNQPKKIFYANIFGVVFSVVIGIPLVANYGVKGALTSLFLVNLSGILFYVSHNYKRQLKTMLQL
ncbi:MAG: polysaccharide biosynthesis C-terminal domain-containing protein [Cyclobacteriaceae bacterium]